MFSKTQDQELNQHPQNLVILPPHQHQFQTKVNVHVKEKSQLFTTVTSTNKNSLSPRTTKSISWDSKIEFRLWTGLATTRVLLCPAPLRLYSHWKDSRDSATTKINTSSSSTIRESKFIKTPFLKILIWFRKCSCVLWETSRKTFFFNLEVLGFFVLKNFKEKLFYKSWSNQTETSTRKSYFCETITIFHLILEPYTKGGFSHNDSNICDERFIYFFIKTSNSF